MLFDHPNSFIEALLGSLIVSIPVIANYLLLLPFNKLNSTTMQIAFCSISGAYVVNLGVAYYFIILFSRAVIIDGTMGEGGGYWLLFTAGFAFKFSLAGAVIGALVSAAYLYFKGPVNNSVN